VQEDNLLVETTGNQRKVEAFIDMMEKFGIHDMTRTGLVAMKRGTLENSKPKTRRK
jgi:acetolactate synthase I/III small subunit